MILPDRQGGSSAMQRFSFKSFDVHLLPFLFNTQMAVRATNQIFFLKPTANNSIRSPLNAAASVCKVRQGDADHLSGSQSNGNKAAAAAASAH